MRVASVVRGFEPRDFICSMAITGDSPDIEPTAGLSIWLKALLASADRLSMYFLYPSA